MRSGITPFPFKVAKALDPDIYRNIEFDSWNDKRKENFLSKNWHHNDHARNTHELKVRSISRAKSIKFLRPISI